MAARARSTPHFASFLSCRSVLYGPWCLIQPSQASMKALVSSSSGKMVVTRVCLFPDFPPRGVGGFFFLGVSWESWESLLEEGVATCVVICAGVRSLLCPGA